MNRLRQIVIVSAAAAGLASLTGCGTREVSANGPAGACPVRGWLHATRSKVVEEAPSPWFRFGYRTTGGDGSRHPRTAPRGVNAKRAGRVVRS